jgi:hypothetical protein
MTTLELDGRLTASDASQEIARWFRCDPSQAPGFDPYDTLKPIIERMKEKQATAYEAQSEADLQYDVVNALRKMGLIVSASANGIKCSGRQMNQMKNRGLVPGWPDLTVITRGGEHVYVELKTPKGKLSPEQVIIHATLKAAGCRVHTCTSVDEVVGLFA